MRDRLDLPLSTPTGGEDTPSRLGKNAAALRARQDMAGAALAPVAPARRSAWAGYAAAALALLSAAVSFYWAAGGTAGLDTIGGEIARLGRARDPAIIAVVWGTGVAKVVAGVLALALVRPWGRVFPRWLLLVGAWGASALLTAWGGLNVVVGGLVLAGVVAAPASADWTALRWHVALWDSWFLVWGLLLGAAAWGFWRGRRGPRATARDSDGCEGERGKAHRYTREWR